MKTKSLTVIIDEQLYFAVKSAAPATGKKMSAWISDALRAALPSQKAKRG